MKYCRVVAYVEGEAVAEPAVPLFCLPFLRWVARMLGATMAEGPVQDTRKGREAR